MTDFVDKYVPLQVMRINLYRPKLTPLLAPRQWWCYAIRSTILQLRFIRGSAIDSKLPEETKEVIEELRYEASLLYLKATPLGLRIMTMEGLREEVQFLRQENEMLRSMLATSYASPVRSKSQAHSISQKNSIQDNLIYYQEEEKGQNTVVSKEDAVDAGGKESAENENVNKINAENGANENMGDKRYEDEEYEDDGLPESSIERLLDAATKHEQQARVIQHENTTSSVTLHTVQAQDIDQFHVAKEPSLIDISIATPLLSVSAPMVQAHVNRKKSYRSQLQQHMIRMHRASVIRAAAAVPVSVHADYYPHASEDTTHVPIFSEDAYPETSSGEAEILSMEESLKEKLRKKDVLPQISREKRSRQISRAYNTAPFVLRPSTRTPSKKKRKSKSRSSSRRSNSRQKEGKLTQKNRPTSPHAQSSSQAAADSRNIYNQNSIGNENVDDDADTVIGDANVQNCNKTVKTVEFKAQAKPSDRSNSPIRLPLTTADLNPAEKLAASIIQKVRTHNGKKAHSPEAQKKLSPSEMLLLKSPFAQPVFNKATHKSPVPPSFKRSNANPLTSSPISHAKQSQPQQSPRAKHIVLPASSIKNTREFESSSISST